MEQNSIEELPISTQMVLNSSSSCDEQPIKHVFLIFCAKTGSKGTGFLLESGLIITNEHVIRGCLDSEILAVSSTGLNYQIKKSIVDVSQDLAILVPQVKIEGGLKINTSALMVRQEVHTWGFPLFYNGPAPLLSVGYLSGFRLDPHCGKRLIVNGAFNQGNSGGPLFKADTDEVVGVVVAKWAPFTNFQTTALEALKNNRSGFQYEATDNQGNKISFAESQLVADLLYQHRVLVQVMIGEAIPAEVLDIFLKKSFSEIGV